MKKKERQMEFDVFLKGKLVDLICLNEKLVETSNWYKWFNDEENMKHMQKHYFPNTKEQQLEYFRKNIQDNPTKLQLGILHIKDQVLIGTISLSSIDFLNRKCEIGGFIGENKYQKFSYFIEANKLIIKHAFDNLNMNRIYGGTIIKEVAAMYCRVLGFKEEGIKRSDVYKNGKYYDAYLLGLLKEDHAKVQ